MGDEKPAVISAKFIEEASALFDKMTADRHEMGAEKYGPVNFLEVNSFRMAMEELADLSNYARYCFIKLRILEETVKAYNKLIDVKSELGGKLPDELGIEEAMETVKAVDECTDPDCAVDHSVKERPR